MEEIKEYKYKWYEFGCKDASYLVTKQESVMLSFSERAMLKFHLATCSHCRRFVKQVKEINELLRKGLDISSLKLSEEKKHVINQLIIQNLTKK